MLLLLIITEIRRTFHRKMLFALKTDKKKRNNFEMINTKYKFVVKENTMISIDKKFIFCRIGLSRLN